jgi:3-oxoadipate enol-lactonase
MRHQGHSAASLRDDVGEFRSRWLEREQAPALYLQQRGEGASVCLLIHGLGDAGHVWDNFVGRLGPTVPVAMLDLRGHGDSEWDSSGQYSVDAYVADLVYVIEAMNWRRVALVGHSMGAEIAIRASASCAERIAGMVIADFGPSLNPAGVRQVREQLRNADRIYQSPAEYARWLEAARPLAQPRIVGDFAARALRQDASGGLRLKSDPALAVSKQGDRGSAAESDVDVWDLLRKLRFPVLLVRGAGSAVLTRTVADQMAQEIPDADLVTVPSAGHAIMMDNPAGFADAVCPFVATMLEDSLW